MDAKAKPAAFLSYDHLDDKYGHISQFRERLADEVCIQTGEDFLIFQDRSDIQWGDSWKRRIEDSLDAVTFFIPIVTPSFFKSEYCRAELKQFIERERKLNRRDLILPVYYVSTPLLDDALKRNGDDLATEIANRQYADWRDLRFEPFDSSTVGKELERLASQIRCALEDAEPLSYKVDSGRSSNKPALNERSSARKRIKHSNGLERSWEAGLNVIVADQMHRGDHTTITEAIIAANPGDCISVRPGLYEEGQIIDKPLEILGEGDLHDIVVRATGQSALLFKTTMGRISNLTFQKFGREVCPCLDIAQGRLEIEECDITSQSTACCVAIHGGADPRLRKNRIHDGRSEGIYVYDSGQGTLEDNDIFSNAGPGVVIGECGSPVLRHNRINRNCGEAIRILEKGSGTIEDNDLRNNIRGSWKISKEVEQNLKRSGNLE